MRTLLTICFVVSLLPASFGQMCPGGGTNFASAVTFDPAWIYGCNTGTSCNGGVNFDNRVACEPTTSLDACAPAPSCATANPTGSDIWYKFYASSTSVTISSFQNTSFVIGLQAFSGGPTCGSLVTIGCSLAAGPSSGVSLTMSGLTAGALYYFRVFGSASSISQRTGVYCFCGSTGLQDVILSADKLLFRAANQPQDIEFSWTVAAGNDYSFFEVQKSGDGKIFDSLTSESARPEKQQYNVRQKPSAQQQNMFYRLKAVNSSGRAVYSSTSVVSARSPESGFSVSNLPGSTVVVTVTTMRHFLLYDASGLLIQKNEFLSGTHELPVKDLPNGIYFLRSMEDSKVAKIFINR